MAHMTALAAARHHLLSMVGWNVEHDGLYDAPKITLIAGAQRHLTIDLALGYLGFGSGAIRVIPVDEAGRMRTDALAEVLARTEGPTIVCAQLGDVNAGAIDPISEICDLCDREDIWVHVDGAFGMWAAASPAMCHLVEGVEKADSWSTDAHKWLNVPYDCGIVMVSRPEAHRAAMLNQRAAYLPPASPDQRRH